MTRKGILGTLASMLVALSVQSGLASAESTGSASPPVASVRPQRNAVLPGRNIKTSLPGVPQAR